MPAFAFPQVEIAIRTLVALMFLTGAIGKLRHFVAFRGVLGNYRLLPEFLVMPVALILPPVEAATAVGLLLGWAVRWPALCAMGLLALFALAMGINIGRGRRTIDCGCFQSAQRQQLSWRLVARNALLVFLLLQAASPMTEPVDSWAVLSGLLVGGVLFLILQSLDILWNIVPAWRVGRPPAPVVSS